MAKPEELAWLEVATCCDPDECCLWPFRTDQWGNPTVQLDRNDAYGSPASPNVSKRYAAHSRRNYNAAVVVLVDTGYPHKGRSWEPVHTCGHKLCINWHHLVWRHKKETRARFSLEQQLEIAKAPGRAEEVAVKFNVSYGYVTRMRTKHGYPGIKSAESSGEVGEGSGMGAHSDGIPSRRNKRSTRRLIPFAGR